MSSLAKALREEPTGVISPACPSLGSYLKVQSKAIIDDALPTEAEYRLVVLFQSREFYKRDQGPTFANAASAARRNVVEAVFGEFRPMLYSLEEALHARDLEQAVQLTGEIYRAMFEEGV